MAMLLSLIYENLRRLDAEYKDVRTDNLLLMGSPVKIIAISIMYWFFVKRLGPEFMKNRQPFELKYVLFFYNLLQIVANIYLAYASTRPFLGAESSADWGCIHNSSCPELLRLTHYYYLLKVADYADTVFFVLRKRYNQISFLHVYHHILMALGCYATRYIGFGHFLMLGYINTYVHAVMYFYYLMSSLRTGMKSSLWWKKHITQLQILQFLLLIVHFARPLFRRDCDQSSVVATFCLLQNIFMAAMFVDFYVKAYVTKSKIRRDKEKIEM